MSRKGWFLFVVMGVIWGLPYLLIKISVREVAAPMLVEMRTGGACLILVPLALGRGVLVPVLRRWRPLLAFTLCEIAVPWLFLFSAERRLSSSLSGLLVAAVPLIGGLLGWVTGADRLDRRRVVGVLVGLGGVAALVGFDVGRSSLLAALSIGVVAIGYALGPLILTRYLSDLPGLGVIAAGLLIAAVLYAPFAAFNVPTRSLSASVITSIVGLTVVCTAAAFLLFFELIAEVGPVRSTVITYVNPAVAVFLGVAVLNEKFGLGTAVGFVLIVAGCVLATSRNAKARPEVAPPSVLVEARPQADQAGHHLD
jgi:drug/metabolite transporter (DMT)-like permease